MTTRDESERIECFPFQKQHRIFYSVDDSNRQTWIFLTKPCPSHSNCFMKIDLLTYCRDSETQMSIQWEAFRSAQNSRSERNGTAQTQKYLKAQLRVSQRNCEFHVRNELKVCTSTHATVKDDAIVCQTNRCGIFGISVFVAAPNELRTSTAETIICM